MISKKELGHRFEIGGLLFGSRALGRRMLIMAPSSAQAAAQPWEKKSGLDESTKQDHKDLMFKGSNFLRRS